MEFESDYFLFGRNLSNGGLSFSNNCRIEIFHKTISSPYNFHV
jgi:hypothetical protein